jgi:hypothetical protein
LERISTFGALRRFGSGVFRRRSLIGHAVKGSGERNYLRGLDRLEQGVGSATLGVSLRHWIDLQGRSECLADEVWLSEKDEEEIEDVDRAAETG